MLMFAVLTIASTVAMWRMARSNKIGPVSPSHFHWRRNISWACSQIPGLEILKLKLVASLKDEEVVKEKTSKEIRRFHGRLMRWVVESSVSNAVLMILNDFDVVHNFRNANLPHVYVYPPSPEFGWSNMAADWWILSSRCLVSDT